MSRKENKSVFELYAHEYDILTDAAKRVKHHEKEVATIIKRFKPRSVLDAGCGTGLTSMLFARHGIQTVGLDRSRSMLAEAKKKYDRFRLPLEFRYGHFELLPMNMQGRFDLVVCLANSIVGVGSLSNLRKALRNFSAALNPGGTLLLQMLNYASMKESVPYPVKVTESNGIVYERFSIRSGRSVTLFVTRADLNQRPPTLEVFRHEFDSFTVNEVCEALKRIDFCKLHKYADLLFAKRFSKTACDLVITAEKPT